MTLTFSAITISFFVIACLSKAQSLFQFQPVTGGTSTKSTTTRLRLRSNHSKSLQQVPYYSYSCTSSTSTRIIRTGTELLLAKKGTIEKKKNKNKKQPKLIIFDLDGCLWRPEMYEIMFLMGGQGSPFSTDEKDPSILRTKGGDAVELLGNVRDVMYELQYDPKWWNTHVGISSRTDEPNWARELLNKFQIYKQEQDGKEKEKEDVDEDLNVNVYPPFSMEQVFTTEICELAHDSKVLHFERILKNAPGKPKFHDCLFFDNELGNCRQIAKLGVTVCYCPNGITKKDWDTAVARFPNTNGKVIGK